MYGLGCDPFSESALQRIIALKERPSAKGLIIVADQWERVHTLTQPLSNEQYNVIFDSWPGHTTWLFPASDKAPSLIIGDHSTIAIRISAHPLVHDLCAAYGGPIVSTSANKHQQAPCLNARAVLASLALRLIVLLTDQLDKLYPQAGFYMHKMANKYVKLSPSNGNVGQRPSTLPTRI